MLIHLVHVISLWGRCHYDLHVTEEAEAQRVGATWQTSHSQSAEPGSEAWFLVPASTALLHLPGTIREDFVFYALGEVKFYNRQEFGPWSTMFLFLGLEATADCFSNQTGFSGVLLREIGHPRHVTLEQISKHFRVSVLRYGTCRHPQHKIRIWSHQ